jgi:hypothetical protein
VLEVLPYAPPNAAGTVSLGASALPRSLALPVSHITGKYTLLFVHKHFPLALAFILVGILTQVAALARLPLINTHDNLATQLCVKAGAALSVLALLHALGLAFGVRAPLNTLVQALAGTVLGSPCW